MTNTTKTLGLPDALEGFVTDVVRLLSYDHAEVLFLEGRRRDRDRLERDGLERPEQQVEQESRGIFERATEQNQRKADIRASGRLLARRLEAVGIDCRPVLDIVNRLDGGGGIPAVREVWATTKVELQRAAIGLRVAAAAGESSEEHATENEEVSLHLRLIDLLKKDPTITKTDAATRLGVSRATLYRNPEAMEWWDHFQNQLKAEARQRAERNSTHLFSDLSAQEKPPRQNK